MPQGLNGAAGDARMHEAARGCPEAVQPQATIRSGGSSSLMYARLALEQVRHGAYCAAWRLLPLESLTCPEALLMAL